MECASRHRFLKILVDFGAQVGSNNPRNYIKFHQIWLYFGVQEASREPPGGSRRQTKTEARKYPLQDGKTRAPRKLFGPNLGSQNGPKIYQKKTKCQNHLFRDFGTKRAPKRSPKMVPKSYEKWTEFRMPSVSVLGSSRRRFLKDVPRENMVFKNRPKTVFLDF